MISNSNLDNLGLGIWSPTMYVCDITTTIVEVKRQGHGAEGDALLWDQGSGNPGLERYPSIPDMFAEEAKKAGMNPASPSTRTETD
jgi:hypothetical protein